MERHKYLILLVIYLSLNISIHNVKGIPAVSKNITNDSMISENEVLFISVNATEEDVLEISSRIRVPTDQAIDDKAPLVVGNSYNGPIIKELSRNSVPLVTSYGLPKAAAPITSTHNVRLRMNPASKLNGAPGDNVNIEFQLTNLGQERYFAVSSEERYINSGQVNFPDTSLTHGLSERKAFVKRDETHPIVISIHVPRDARIGTVKEITIEVQPYVNTNTGNTNYLTRRFYFVVDDKNPEDYDFDDPTCNILEDNRAEICEETLDNQVSCDQRRWNGKISVQDTGSGLKSMLESSLGLDSFGTSLDLSNAQSVYSRDNFIIGSKLPAEFTFGTTCCIDQVTLTIYDLANNQQVCSAGSQPEVQLSSLTITVVVISLVLVVVLAVAIISIVCIRRRRNAELAEMRSLPQER